MSEIHKQNPKSNTEEVDLVVFFNLIGNAFARLFNSIGRVLQSVFFVYYFHTKSYY